MGNGQEGIVEVQKTLSETGTREGGREGDAPLRHINLNLAQNTHRPPDDDTSVFWASAIFEETEVKTRTLRARSTGRPMGEETSLTGRSVSGRPRGS